MYQFTLWACIVLFCVDYNSAGYSDREIHSLKEQVDRWHERKDHVCSSVKLKENASGPETKVSVNLVEKISVDGGRHDATHFRFDLMKDGKRSSSFYDFQIEAFVYYFEKSVRFALREGGERKILSLDFASEKDLRYFYSKVAKFGNISPGTSFDSTVYTCQSSVVTYKRSRSVKRTTRSRVDITVHSLEGDEAPIYKMATYAIDGGTVADVPLLIFSSRQFNIGSETMGKRVMMYLIDYPDIIIAVSFPSERAATKFYDSIKENRFNDDMLSLEEMRKYVA